MKNEISAEIIADSKNEHGQRLPSLVLTFPRFILAELNTHRMFSRNSASSRAIPFKKMLEKVQEDPFIPIAWQKDHSGMQGTEYLGEDKTLLARSRWLDARDAAVENAIRLSQAEITKQLCNRLLEPFLWHTAIVTATEYENFFALRCPQYWFSNFPKEVHRSKRDAKIKQPILNRYNDSDLYWLNQNKGQGEIHIMALAEAMWDAVGASEPKVLKPGEWHIPDFSKLELQ